MEDKRLEKRKEFFNPVKDGKIEREKFMIDLRKKRKQELFRSKRNLKFEEESKNGDKTAGNCYLTNDGITSIQKSEDIPHIKYRNILENIVPLIYSDVELSEKLISIQIELSKENEETETYLALISYIREISCTSIEKVADILVRIRMIPDILKFTIATDHLNIMHELTWILVNMTSINSEEVILELIDMNKNGNYDVIGYLLDMASQSTFSLKEHSMWALANLCQEDQRILQLIAESQILNDISKTINSSKVKVGLVRQIAFLMAQLMKYKHKTKEMIEISIEILSSILFFTDFDVVADCCYAFMNFTVCCEEDEELEIYKYNQIGKANIIHKIVSLIQYSNKDLLHPVILTVGNIASSGDKCCENQILESDILKIFQKLFEINKSERIK